jgi:hypothetical protein
MGRVSLETEEYPFASEKTKVSRSPRTHVDACGPDEAVSERRAPEAMRPSRVNRFVGRKGRDSNPRSADDERTLRYRSF